MASTGAKTGLSQPAILLDHEAPDCGTDSLGALLTGGCDQNVVDEVGGRLDFGQGLQPAPSGVGLGQQWAADRASPGVSLETSQLWPG